MRYCITCGKSKNSKEVVFVGTQCKGCYELAPYTPPNVIVIDKKKKERKSPFKRVRFTKDEIFERCCRVCKERESWERKFFRNKKGYVLNIHSDCREDKIRESKRKYYLKKRKEPRKALTPKERIAALPEELICNACGNKLHISRFYIKNNGRINQPCKSCFYQRYKPKGERREKYLAYLRNYNKTYTKKNRVGVIEKILQIHD